MPKPFVNLHTHSCYSILQSSTRPDAIVEKALELECPAVALTDSGVGYGLIEFFTAAKKSNIKPILGAEIFVAKDSRFERRAGIDGNEGCVVVLAQNQKGYDNVLQLLSKAQLEGFFEKPRVDFELLEAHEDGLVMLSGGTDGLIGKVLHQQGEKAAKEMFERLKTVFGDQLYLELIARSGQKYEELNRFKLDLAQSSNTQMIVSSNAHFTNSTDEEATDTMYCIGENIRIHDDLRIKPYEGNYFRSFEEMMEVLDYIDSEILEKAREKTLEIADSIDLDITFGTYHLPAFEVPEGETEASQLRKECVEAIKSRYGDEMLEEVMERLDYELSVIGKMGFDAYFLIVADFIRFAREHGIAVGPGRGSAAGSIVAYLMQITNIDPIKYELLFERFLNPARISMPDIDIDFSDERRDEVLQYVIEKYGVENVSRVCTFGTLSAKASLKDVGRVQGVPFAEMNAMTKMLPNRPGFTLDDAIAQKDFKDLLKQKAHLQKVFDVAKQLEGCVRHVSVHACAVIIGQNDLSHHAPLQWAPGTEHVKITQFPYQQLEDLGLLKMDFLGLKNLSVLEKTINNIEKNTGEVLDLNTIPIDDTKTFEMMAAGETTGVFQFESAGMRRYLRELIPSEFEDLVAMNALYRPGPMEYIPVYIKGKHKPEKVKYMHKSLEPILKKTYGIAVYQEQVLKIAQVFAGFSLGEADLLRKAIGKKIPSILAKQREKFIEGAQENKYSEKLAIKIFDEIVVPFSGYGFNRSHAVCYARIAYETAYLRANYPVEFMAAMMTADRSNTDRIVLEMNECQAMEIEVLPPSVNESGSYFTVIEGTSGEQRAASSEQNNQKTLSLRESEANVAISSDDEMKGRIRFGLTAIKGMGEETVQQIIRERNSGGRFKDLQDFAKRVPSKLMNKKTLEALSFSGAFDEFGNRKAIVDSLDDLAKFAKEFQQKADAGQMGLFGGIDTEAVGFALKKTLATKDDILRWERESLGLFVSDHPLKGLDEYFERYGSPIGNLSIDEDAKKRRTIHGIVTNVRRIATRSGRMMAIITIEDITGKIEVALFPQIYDIAPKKVFEEDTFLRIRGKVEERDGRLNMLGDEMRVLDLKALQKGIEKNVLAADVYKIEIPRGTTREQVSELKKILSTAKAETGGMEVEIFIEGKEIALPFCVNVTEDLKQGIENIVSG